MKLPINLAFATVTLLAIGCTKDTTEYHGFVKNNTKNQIHVEIFSDNSLVDTVNVNAEDSKKIAYSSEDGDFEIYDCSSFFDSLVVSSGDSMVTITPSNAEIASSSDQGSDGTRTHECTVIFK